MKLTVIGLGYVGLTAASCLSDVGNIVFAIDSDVEKIARIKKFIMPFYEPGLENIVSRNLKNGRIKFSCDLKEAISNSDVVLITVGTPADKKNITDLSQVNYVAASISTLINSYKLIIIKSTVPPGTCNKIKSIIKTKTSVDFDCISNPEFLRQGSAVKDFLNPARIIIGTDNPKTAGMVKILYKPFIGGKTRVIVMDPISAELTKYASNAMLAARVSFMNELSMLCEKIGADIKHVHQGVGSDPRIGSEFLNAGIGYGGSCLPKDIATLISFGNRYGCEMIMAKAIRQANIEQRKRFIRKILKHFKGSQAKLSVWGLAFKGGTNDVRQSPAVYCIERLLKKGFQIKAYDPLVSANTSRTFENKIIISADKYDVLDGADALVIFTDSVEFKNADLELISSRVRVIFDGKNLFDSDCFEHLGIEYHCIGRDCDISKMSLEQSAGIDTQIC